jgi:dipeptide transport system ATP-binding protein
MSAEDQVDDLSDNLDGVSLDRVAPRTVLEAKHLHKTYRIRQLFKKAVEVRALNDVSFSLAAGKTLAVVGESGSGKSTLAKCLMRIESLDLGSGDIWLDGQPMGQLTAKQWRHQIQMIFQDPYSSLNPRRRVIDIISEPLVIAGENSSDEIRQRALEMMAKVGLRPEFGMRFPHMFSGGQRQRIGIARALMLQPRILICDEPVSALDVSIQAQVLNLLMDLQDDLGLSYIFISHDLSVVKHIADEILVMHHGQVMEYGVREQIFLAPQHAYTQTLLASHPAL